jgi:hypothetical protein
MALFSKKSVAAITLTFWAFCALAAPDANICAELSPYFANSQTATLPDPSRKPTQAERSLIDKAKLELLESTDYARGVLMVDADNDGKDDVFAWAIQGW